MTSGPISSAGKHLLAEAEALFPARTVLAVMEALRYDLLEGGEVGCAWYARVVRCEGRDFVAAHAVQLALEAGVDRWSFVDLFVSIAERLVRKHGSAIERQLAAEFFEAVAYVREGLEPHEAASPGDYVRPDLPRDVERTALLRLCDYVLEAALFGADRTTMLRDSVLDIVRIASELPGYSGEVAQEVVEHAQREIEARATRGAP
jgi:hypothetical protein